MPVTNPHCPQTFTTIPDTRPVTPILDRIDTPFALKALSQAQLLQLADELRLFLLYASGQSGGHFGANLGVVELTIALHCVLNAPKDQLIWDVGHQAYAHKALTGRREELVSIRTKDGLTAFPERNESVYDTFGVGHSSTAISAGLGMSLALRHQGRLLGKDCDAKVVCVVGDGAMTGGMAFEAMNDAVQQNADLLVVLNDNDMSISCATGGFAQHLAELWRAGLCVDIDAHGNPSISKRTFVGDDRRMRHLDAKVLQEVCADNLFKAIGFRYFGPFDGHDLPKLIDVFNKAKQLKGAVLIHVHTTKGKGYLPAEADPVGYHAIAKLPDKSSQLKQNKPQPKKYSQIFGEFLIDKVQTDKRLLAITPAMAEGSGMVEFACAYPEHFFDVAIAEQHAVTLAGGMATQGMKPIVAIYSTFLQRGYDQFIHDIALQNLDVLFAIDRAGLVGEDGATHAGVFDLAYLRCVPNIIIATPKDEDECYHLLHTCYEYQGVAAVRYPRGAGIGKKIHRPFQYYDIGKGQIDWQSSNWQSGQTHRRLALLVFGTLIHHAIEAAKEIARHAPIAITVVNMRWVKPLDGEIIDRLIREGVSHIATIEEHVLMGGAGSAVNEYLVQTQQSSKACVKNLGIEDTFIAHASHEEQLSMCNLDVKGITNTLISWLKDC